MTHLNELGTELRILVDFNRTPIEWVYSILWIKDAYWAMVYTTFHRHITRLISKWPHYNERISDERTFFFYVQIEFLFARKEHVFFGRERLMTLKWFGTSWKGEQYAKNSRPKSKRVSKECYEFQDVVANSSFFRLYFSHHSGHLNLLESKCKWAEQ